MIELKEQFERIILSRDEFPIDFLWTTNVVDTCSSTSVLMPSEILLKNFIIGVDFVWSDPTTSENNEISELSILISVECFKAFCLLVQTEVGKKVRLYFLELEKELSREKFIQEWFTENLELELVISESRKLTYKAIELLRMRRELIP